MFGKRGAGQYGKGLRGYSDKRGLYRVFGSNGPIGWHNEAISNGPGVILGRKGAYRGVQYSRDPFFVIDTAYYVVPKTEIDLRWLYYAIIHHRLGEIDDGSPIPSTTRAAVYIRDVDVPPINEQHAIAAVLGTLDDKIELNEQMNVTLDGMGQRLFKSWFVDFDPVRARADCRNTNLQERIADLFPDKFEGSEIGDVPHGWGIRSVYDCATFVNGLAFRTGSFSQGKVGLPVIKIGELKAGLTSQTKFTTDEFAPKYRVRSGDVLFSWSGSPETSIDTFLWTDVDGWLNQHIFKVHFHAPNQKLFVYYLLRYLNPIFIEIARNKQTTGLGHVTADDMKRLQVCWPSENVLSAFEQTAAPLFEKAYSNSKTSATLAELRNTLLPKVVSGELRIPDAERIVGGQV